jgi:hypothetical protein
MDTGRIVLSDGATLDYTYTPPPVAPPPPPPPTGKILWSTGFESGDLRDLYAPSGPPWDQSNPGINNGGGEFNSGSYSCAPSKDYAHSGSWCCKTIIDTGAGVSGVRLFRWKETQADLAGPNAGLYMSAWYLFPLPWNVGSWQQIWECKSKHPAGDDAFWQLNLKNRPNGNLYLVPFNWPTQNFLPQVATVDVPINRWFKIECYVKPASDATGIFRAWQDDVLIAEALNVPTRYADGDYEFAVTNYGQGFTPSGVVIYVDDLNISSDRIANSV